MGDGSRLSKARKNTIKTAFAQAGKRRLQFFAYG
jgi:hypothetical protein